MSFDYQKKNIVLAKNLRKNATSQENHLWYDYLSKFPIRFQRQKPIGNYIAGFYCHKAKLVIELDGTQHFSAEESKRDDQRTANLSEYGLRVLRFSNRDVDCGFKKVCAKIEAVVEEQMKNN